MSIVGVDFGTGSFTVANAAGAGAQRGGITIVLNEGTSRFTPSLVTFHESKRHIGQLAAPLARAQFKNTVSRIKCLIGRKFSDPFVQQELKNIDYTVIEQPNDEIGIQVTHDGQTLVFSPTQILAMQLGNIVEFTQAYSGKKNVEMVITVPAFFTDAQRRAVRDAAAIANVRLLKLVNEATATALSYGIFRRAQFSEDEDKPTNVMFVDMGDTNFSATVVAFTKQGIQVKGCAYERNVGGFYIDVGIANRMADEFEAKTKIDIRTKPKAFIKAKIAAEKLKKTLSPDGVNIAKSSIECLYQEHDFRFQMTQEEFDEMFQPLADRIEKPINDALEMAGLTKSDLFAVEMVGGGVRVPIIKRKIAEVLGTDLSATNFGLSATLNQDECVARGGALQCAMLSPSIRVIQYALKDVILYPIRISWDDGANEIELLKKGSTFPAFKKITFNRRGKFNVDVSYSDPETLPPGTNPKIGTFEIGDDETLTPEGDATPKIRVIMAYDEDGTFSIRSAEYMKEKIVEEAPDPDDHAGEGEAKPATEGTEDAKKADGEAESPKKEGGDAEGEASADTNSPEKDGEGSGDAESPKKEGGEADAAASPAAAKPKKKFTAVPLAISCSGISAMNQEQLTAARDEEARMAQAERILRERDQKRNDLETAIYNYRDQFADSANADFVTPETVAEMNKLLDEYEDWIYTEEGFDGQKSLFTERLDKLHGLGRPMLRRKKQFEQRPKAIEEFNRVRVEQLEKINNQDEAFAHITTEEREKVRGIWATAAKWLEDKVAEQESKGKTELILSNAEIEQRARTAANECLPVLNKPKPAPEPEPEPEKTEGGEQENADGATGEEGEKKADAPADPAPEGEAAGTAEPATDDKAPEGAEQK
eukprot:INCI14687.1.p1 GENE.INCI14687.1~~INCI14687.1.p1  ORF type:complete len:879 (+),score=202.68 INCI14687.1:124-2760(+)